ncbi:MAG: VWA domain-containing protein [Nitrospirae bacterium]|nr:VWA domain-containing protein [Nitrospirota bacterium]MBI3594742.1 VWA domain-containing protein [Nitrospirota bacterium]
MPSEMDNFYHDLNGISPKAARAFQTIGEELHGELSSEVFQSWFHLGSVISYSSSANGIRYFNESGQQIRKMASHASLNLLLQKGIQLGFAQNSMALDYFRMLSELIHIYPAEVISHWADIGKEIAETDYLTGSEYFKSGSAILNVLDPPLLKPWGSIGLLLSQEDRLNKSFMTLEYFRTTPEFFRQVKKASFYPQCLYIGHALALQVPKDTLSYFKTLPQIFKNLPQNEGTELIFSLAAELAFQTPVAVVDFLTHATDVLKMMNGSLHSLKRFVETGSQMHAPPDAIKSFFSLKSKKSIEAIQELSHAIFLSEVRKRLTYFAEMITGHPVEILPGPIPSSYFKNQTGTILLPEKINRYTNKEDNYKLYKMMLLHESAHIEFGSYAPLSLHALEELETLFPGNRGLSVDPCPVWNYFPDPVLAQNLWTIAEESRIDFLLRSEYPGAVKDLSPILQSQKSVRPDLFNLPEEKGIMEALFQLSVHENIVVPLPIANLVSSVFADLKTLWRPGSSNENTLHTVCVIYQKIQNKINISLPGVKTPELIPVEEMIPNYGIIPESAFSHHGLITPELAFQTDSAQNNFIRNLNMTEKDNLSSKQGNPLVPNVQANKDEANLPLNWKGNKSEGFSYDEWDWMIQDYKPGWCSVIEKRVDSSQKASAVMESSRGSLLSIRRYFEKLKPENIHKTRKEYEGEELDFDRIVDLVVDIRTGTPPSENFYIRRAKRVRNISVALLVDLSGSTGQAIPGSKKRVIDIEKESLHLMAEALKTIGDDYGIFGFSGQSRNSVEFYIIKDFNMKNDSSMRINLESLEPLGQNRDGAAIRHLIEKLSHRDARTKLFITISDGKPLDDDYSDLYALEDTKQALKEARQKGIHPFCITVDKQANDYIKKMYQDVNFTYISDIETLPIKLPLIYKKLTT